MRPRERVGAVTALAGAGPLVGGITGPGRQLTPFPRPVADAALRWDGVFGLVRHPMDGRALLLILGWALLSSPLVLLTLGLAAVFLDAKRRPEEAWLVGEHPDYPDYRRAVPRQFIPWVW
jgi:protein-S-isoprenylcysteine O-methyltransferase Ste14